MKICGHCRFEKDDSEFGKDTSRKDKLTCWCKICDKQYREDNKEKNATRKKKHYENNKEEILKQSRKYHEDNREVIIIKQRQYYTENKKDLLSYKKQYYEDNKERILEQAKATYEKNKDKILEKRKSDYESTKTETLVERKLYYENNKDKILEDVKKYSSKPETKTKICKRRKERRASDINYKLSRSLTHRLYNALKGNFKSGSAVNDFGCSIPEFKMRLERQFEPGMTWENYGTHWHIDHIIPISSFDLTDRMEFLEACNWCNLQPLWAEDNLRKSNKLFKQENE